MTRRKRILIVDDDQGVCEALSLALRRQYDVLVASRGGDALAIIAREPVDLILLDWLLPDMLGGTVLREVRATFPEIPILIMSVLQKEVVAHAAGGPGATFYIPKPFMVSELVAHIRLLTGPHPHPEGGSGGGGWVEAPAPTWRAQQPNGGKPRLEPSRNSSSATNDGVRG
jgi:DNA-binding response OmpR family regulator